MIKVPIKVTALAIHLSSLPITIYDKATNATETNTQANYISLLIIAIICFLARLSTTTVDV